MFFFDCTLKEPQKFSKDGCEQHMQVNHLAPALLTVLLLPSLARGAPSRVVMVNSIVSFLTPYVFPYLKLLLPSCKLMLLLHMTVI